MEKGIADNAYKCCVKELTELVSTIGNMENTFAEREVQGEILDQLYKAQQIIKGALNDVKDIMNGDNPYA